MKREKENKNELPDIPEWVNAAYYRNLAARQEETTQQEQKSKSKAIKFALASLKVTKTTVFAAAFVGAVAVGVYLGMNAGTTYKQTVQPAKYVVQPHETLWDIVYKLHGDTKDKRETVHKVMQENNIEDAGTLKPGTVLNIQGI